MDKFWEFRQDAKKQDTLELHIYSTVESDFFGRKSETSAKHFRDELAQHPNAKEIKVYINSLGGSVMEGIAIYNQLKRHAAHKTVYVDGFACSIASVIAMAGDTVIMPKNAVMMIHNANAAAALGMKVIGYDAYISPSAAWKLSPAVKEAKSYDEIYKNADYITLHVPSTPTTKNMICKDTIALMKDGVRIINLARADLVCADDIKDALNSGKVKKYVTDFPTNDTVGANGILNIPHLGASTEEAEDNCAVMAAEQLRDYLLCGNVKNSVNFPNLTLECKGEERVCVAYKNSPEAVSLITAAFAKAGATANAMGNATRGELGYLIADTDFADADKIKAEIEKVDGVISVKLY